jgi:hypothetical protein
LEYICFIKIGQPKPSETFRKKALKSGLFVTPTKREDDIVSDVNGYGLKAIIKKAYPAVCQP